MKRKALFFDVDGTLLSEITHQVPESAKRALSEARKRGNLVFINSGRGYGFLRDIEQMIEHDGCLCGCGTCVADAEGHILLQYRIPHERGIEIKKAVLRYGFDGILEATEGNYFREELSLVYAALTDNDIRDGALYLPVSRNSFTKNPLMKQNIYWSWRQQ